MRTARFQSLSLSSLRSSIRSSRSRSPSDSSMTSSSRDSCHSTSDPVSEIKAIMQRQPSMVDMEEEKKSFATGLEILEPRPIVYWGGMEERMASR
ncbi:hypothetical protein BJ875DRAFT_365631 [Amylocarpus encephaloides]|uniref:Uncharacterized protein n=1 Tax=Amylocarpus encephaloides TaxID=45428 RepID=A0A9P8CAE9_9HELO|nr:hypothetical protein BJ875DRAFT_365631 [Amylocarpus encephaloides]